MMSANNNEEKQLQQQQEQVATPSSSSSSKKVETSTATLMHEAETAFENRDFEASVTLYAKCLEESVKQNEGDQMAPSFGPLYLAYGKALLQLAIANQSLGIVNESAVDYNLEGDATDKLIELDEYEDESDEEDNNEDVEGDEGNEDDEEFGEEEEGAENGDDFALAWEVLDIARLIFSKQDSAKLQEAEALQEMGDLSMETENFANAVSDYKKAAEILDLIDGSLRERASLHFKIGIALEFEGSDLSAAKASYQKAKDILVQIVSQSQDNNNEDEEDDKTPLKKEKTVDGEDLKELKSLISEVEAKMNELDNGSTTATSLKVILMDAAKSASSTTAAQVNDLSSLVKKRKATTVEEEENDSSKHAKND